ncbi:MAG: hypothetical protein ACR2PO_16280 [Methyloligellaceae bacterium]
MNSNNFNPVVGPARERRLGDQTRRLRRGVKTGLGRLVVTTGLVLGATGATALTSSQAQAFGISDITGVIEDVWEIGADGIERAGRAIGREARKISRGELRPTGRPRRRVPGANNGAPPPRGESSRPSDSRLPPPRRTAGQQPDRKLPPARGTSGQQSGSKLPPARRKNERIVVRRKVQGIRVQDVLPSGKGANGSIARDRSIWGRPLNLDAKKRRNSSAPVQGITRENLKPNRKAKGSRQNRSTIRVRNQRRDGARRSNRRNGRS